MAILSKGTTYSDGDQVNTTNLHNLVDAATFVSGSSGTTDDSSLEVNGFGRLQAKDGGISSGKIAAGAVTTAKLADSTSSTTGVTFGKMRWMSTGTVIGNTSGATAAPSAVTVLDEDDMSSDSATSLATQQSIKAYVDATAGGGVTAPTGATMATSGSVTLPGGVIVKFGQFELSADAAATLTFPTAFPNNCWTVVETVNTGATEATKIDSLTTTGFQADRNNSIDGTSVHNFIAIGN